LGEIHYVYVRLLCVCTYTLRGALDQIYSRPSYKSKKYRCYLLFLLLG
jgi:hypothetical protein